VYTLRLELSDYVSLKNQLPAQNTPTMIMWLGK